MSKTRTTHLCDEAFTILIHAIGGAYFALTLISFLIYQIPPSLDALPDALVLVLYFIGILTCSALSILYRSISIFDRENCGYWQRLEHVGIVILIWSSSLPFIYFQFYHQDRALIGYIWLITLTGVRNLVLILDSPPHYPQASRIFIYTGSTFALLTLLPAVHAVFWTSACRYPLAPDYIRYAAFNTIGGLFYLLRFPERWGIVKRWKVSNYAIHVFILGAAVLYSRCLVTAYASDQNWSVQKCGEWRR